MPTDSLIILRLFLNMLNNLKRIISSRKTEIIILTVLLIISGVAHGYNMFHFPYYENDEGTYLSQAWSLITTGKLAPYTYWYDHAPAGWIFIAMWANLTGGFFTFGPSVNSGRVFMLVLHLCTATLLFYIANKLSKGYFAGIIAVLIFSLSPLGIYFQRRVLLDNIMIFWIFLSLALLLKDKLKLSQIILSGVVFGIAVLTKENAVFLLPSLIYLVYSRSHNHHKAFAVTNWLIIVFSITSTYFLYALLKRELFPLGFLGDNSEHVSLMTTLQNQLDRGGKLPFWDKGSDFYISLIGWSNKDTATIVAGAAATILSIILSIRVKSLRTPAILATLFWFFLMRGKLVIDFYIVPLVPLLALNIGVVSAYLTRVLSLNNRYLFYIYNFTLCFIFAGYLLLHPIGQYTNDETTPQVKTIDWIKRNLSEKDHIIIDDSIYVDLHAPRFPGDKVFPNADWAWKVEKDPEILSGKLKDDWKNVSYIALSHEIVKQIKDYKFNFIKEAFANSYLVVDWNEGNSYIDLEKYISTNGDWMAIYKVKDENSIALDTSWQFYKNNYFKSYGQIIDPTSNDKTTSEGQSYALLRSVWQDDKVMFDGVREWTTDHLQYRTEDKLFSWLWIKDGEDYKLGDSATATDADEDIALALMFASKKWGDPKYLEFAKEIISDIWKHEVVSVNKRYYLTSGSGAEREGGYLVNPSYLSPASYRIFSQIDKSHPWEKLSNDSYYLLNEISSKSEVYLPPNWIFIDQKGEFKSASKYILDNDVDAYGYDAFRVMWRIALDALWFNTPEANSYLEKVTPFLRKEWNDNGNFASIYGPDGLRKNNLTSLSTTAGALSAFRITDKDVSSDIYNKVYISTFNFEKGFWEDANNYYTQNWAWFASALYNYKLKNLWTSI